MYLAREGRVEPVTVAEIAGQFAVPRNHLIKVVGALTRLGWIEATRGRGGGLRLQAASMSLRIGDSLRTLEGDGEVIDCRGLGCPLAGDCLLREALATAVAAFYDALNRYCLADLVTHRTGEQIVRLHQAFLARQVVL